MTTKARKPRRAKAKALEPVDPDGTLSAPRYLTEQAVAANSRMRTLLWAATELFEAGAFDIEPARIEAISEILRIAGEAAAVVGKDLEELGTSLPY